MFAEPVSRAISIHNLLYIHGDEKGLASGDF